MHGRAVGDVETIDLRRPPARRFERDALVGGEEDGAQQLRELRA